MVLPPEARLLQAALYRGACSHPDGAVRLAASALTDGVAGTERLTALTGVVLLVGFAIEGVTILWMVPTGGA